MWLIRGEGPGLEPGGAGQGGGGVLQLGHHLGSGHWDQAGSMDEAQVEMGI